MSTSILGWIVRITYIPCLVGVGGGWIYWIQNFEKTTGTIIGLTIVGTIFLVLLVPWIAAALDQLAKPLVFLGKILLSPLLLVYLLFYLIYLTLTYSISLFCCITSSPAAKDEAFTKSDYCRLCEKCELVVERSAILSGSFWRITWSREMHQFHNLEHLRENQSICHLCSLLWDSVPARGSHENRSGNDESSKQGKTSAGLLRLKIRVDRSFSGKRTLWMRIHGQKLIGSKSLRIEMIKQTGFHNCYQSGYTSSPDIFQWARYCIKTCSKNHKECRSEFVPTEYATYLPLRLLYIEPESEGKVSLIHTESLQLLGNTPYLALSHCWGKAVNIQLTKATLNEMSIIPICNLTQTFQDSVSITRSLGLRYLWIDSLCIMQDDEDEWSRESAKMGLVYANAYCVISAAASKDSNGGCYFPRELRHHYCVLQTRREQQLVVHPWKELFALSDLFEEKVVQAPLASRAWTYQERLLARRILHYCAGTVIFECSRMLASELYSADGEVYLLEPHIRADGKHHSLRDCQEVKWPVQSHISKILLGRENAYGIKPWSRYPDKKMIEVVNPKFESQKATLENLEKASARAGLRGAFDLTWRFTGATLSEKASFHERWMELVENYSVRHLTLDSDKLKAFSGIPFFIQHYTGFAFAAGIWLELLPFNLLWVISGQSTKRPYGAVPTWSWASVNGRVSHLLKPAKNSGSPSGKNSKGNPSRMRDEFRNSWHDIKPFVNLERVQSGETIPGYLIPNGTLSLRGHVFDIDSRSINYIPDISTPPTNEKIYFLPILKFRNSRVHPVDSKVQLHGLALKKTSVSGNQYERVGYIWTTNEDIVEEVLIGYQNSYILELV